ncbi:endolysin [Lactococcus phage 1358]|uniref:N-acetylmuramoyl-L-alanine amidase n=1 Tax=Lactococcus phage 1358 TaxID=741942 RepID=D3W0F3_9CAUD|nr:endolysin [Lactococcus phage 1358]ADD25719.1 endolysin [Lactococcus phage 1358]
MVNQAQVKQWIDTHVGKWVDFDGMYGAQCMDLAVQYAHDLWGFRLTGNAENLRNQALPAGWQRIKNSRGFVPQQGDIFVWYGTKHPYGHTGIVISATLNNYTALEQNMVTGKGQAADKAAINTRPYPSEFWGVVRPPITSGGNITPPDQNGTGGKLTAQRGTFKANSAVNIRRAPNTKTGTVAGVLKAGQTVNYDNIIDADGWRWVSWVGASGNRNYSAVRRLSDNFRTGLCY